LFPSRKALLNHQTTIEQQPAPWGELAIADEFHLRGLCQTQFAARVLSGGIAHVCERDWASAAESADAVLPHAVTSFRSDGTHSVLLELGDGVLAVVTVGYGRVTARIAANEPAVLAEAEAWLRGAFPAAVSADSTVAVSFWSYGNCGGTQITRSIRVPSWHEIEANYPASVRDRLARLVDPAFRPAEGGQLVLWHGPPGTGKTYALRALAWAWRDWCDLHYVVDPMCSSASARTTCSRSCSTSPTRTSAGGCSCSRTPGS